MHTEEYNTITPMMQQYMYIKSQHKDYLLFYRMGDFFELFFDDAVVASRELDITLTKRGKHLAQNIPMCGVPINASEFYINKLLKKNYSIAICEQIETPEEAKKRGYKTVVKREVVRIITPGTIMEEVLLESKETNYLAVIANGGNDNLVIAFSDISTGYFAVETIHKSALLIEIHRIMPKEIIISDELIYNDEIYSHISKFSLTRRANVLFDFERCNKQLLDFYNIDHIDGIGSFTATEIIAAGVLIEYLKYTQKNSIPKLQFLNKISNNNFMQIDVATRYNLEIIRGIRQDSCSLLSIIDKTMTSSGGRLLYTYIVSPLIDATAINARLNNIESFILCNDARKKVRELLKLFPDIERSINRVLASRKSIKELFYIRDGLSIAIKIAEIIHTMSHTIQLIFKEIPSFDTLLLSLDETLIGSIDMLNDEVSMINLGINPQLDHLYTLKNNSQVVIEKLRDKYKTMTGISTLKIVKNNVLGYFVEVSTTHSSKMPTDIFHHRQSLGSSVRYVTDELSVLENDIVMCLTKIQSIEQDILEELYSIVFSNASVIIAVSNAIAIIDVIASLAELAVCNNYSRPQVDNSQKFDIVNGYHPMVKNTLKSKFIPNNCNLHEQDLIWLITGPNMAGKSTFLRQNAIICILAQIGSFIPAERAHIGVVDKLFSRIGASDNISNGQSTFMVEMLETAYITNTATKRSLIIMDEVGRGTSTYDGLAIAQSVVEYIHNVIGARMLFATHYHEMSKNHVLSNLTLHTMKVVEWMNNITFMHEVIDGVANKSYGIHVAELAGMSSVIINRAYNILNQLEYSAQSDCILNTYDAHDEMRYILSKIDTSKINFAQSIDVIKQLKKLSML